MWATLHAFEHSDLAGMTPIPAPKCGQHCLDHGRENYGAGLAERVTTV